MNEKKYHLIRFRSLSKNLYIVRDRDSDNYEMIKVLIRHAHIFYTSNSCINKAFYTIDTIFSDESLDKVEEQGMLEIL